MTARTRPEWTAATQWTAVQRQSWADYIDILRRRLLMPTFTIFHDWDHETSDGGTADASTWMNAGEDILRCSWHPGLYDQPPEQQRDTAIHELLHGILKHLDAAGANPGLEKLLHPDAWGIHVDRHTNAIEKTVHHLARIIAPTMPLPYLMGREQAVDPGAVPFTRTAATNTFNPGLMKERYDTCG